jgi:hypothetical protein
MPRESFNNYVEKKENPEYGHTRGRFESMRKALLATREELGEIAKVKQEEIQQRVDKIYYDRNHNLQVEEKRQQLLDQKTDLEDEIKVGEQILEMRKNGGIAGKNVTLEEEVLFHIEQARGYLKDIDGRIAHLDEAVEDNEKHQKKDTRSPLIMGKIQEDAQKENELREIREKLEKDAK